MLAHLLQIDLRLLIVGIDDGIDRIHVAGSSRIIIFGNQLRYFRHGIFFQRHLRRCLRFRCLCRRFRLRLCSGVRSCRLCTVSERDADRNTYRNYCNTCACTNTGLFLVIPKKIQNFFHLFVLHTFRSFLRTLFCAYRVCVKCAQTQISRLKNVIFQSSITTVLSVLFNLRVSVLLLQTKKVMR